MKPIDDGRCFVCGSDNETGLHLKFEPSAGGGVRARTQIANRFQGWRGVTHGGIALALLDEAMAYAAGYAGYRGLTGSLHARFRKPVPLESPIEIEGRVKWMRRNVLEIQARILDTAGAVLVEGEGRFVAHGRVEDADDKLLAR